MPEEIKVYPRHNWNAAFALKRAIPTAPHKRTDAWHRDATASAMAIARWEDDGGRPGRASISGVSPHSSGGRMPLGNRDI
jgi:hypothetical protein